MICVHNSELPFPPVKNKGPYFKVLTIVWRDTGAGIGGGSNSGKQEFFGGPLIKVNPSKFHARTRRDF